MSESDFLVYQKFTDKVIVDELVEALDKKKVEYLLEENIINFDTMLADSQFSKEYTLKLNKVDFDKVDDIQTEISSGLVNSVESDYYLF